jgi:hypothetical protein
VFFRAVRHLFEGIAIRQEEAREKNLSPPEFKVPVCQIPVPVWPDSVHLKTNAMDPDVTLKVLPDPYPEQPLI